MTVASTNTTTAQRALAIGRPSSGRSSAPAQISGPGAKKRILDTADRLFYEDGIRSVGIDRLIAESAVTKATFYKHYGSKDRLISEYLKGRHLAAVEELDALVEHASDSRAVLVAIVQAIAAEVQRPDFRGCAFINAAAEFADPGHPIRVAVSSHRDWYTDTLVAVLRGAGHTMPGDAADEVILARDGAMTGAYAGDPVAAAAALHRAVDRVLAEVPQSAGAPARP